MSKKGFALPLYAVKTLMSTRHVAVLKHTIIMLTACNTSVHNFGNKLKNWGIYKDNWPNFILAY